MSLDRRTILLVSLLILSVAPLSAQTITLGFGPVPVINVGLETAGPLRVRATATAPFPQALGVGTTLIWQPAPRGPYALIGLDHTRFHLPSGAWTQQVARVGLGAKILMLCEDKEQDRQIIHVYVEGGLNHDWRQGAFPRLPGMRWNVAFGASIQRGTHTCGDTP